MSTLKFEGSTCLRQRLILATVASRPIVIKNIRSEGDEQGLNDSEVSLLKLLEKVSNGVTVDVDESGTELRFIPGVLIGGKIEHDCGLKRNISYFLEVLFYLAPFCKTPLDVTLTGITNDDLDPSVDVLKHVHCSLLRKFMNCDLTDVDVTIVSRGLKPLGGGKVTFKSAICRKLRPIQFTDQGKIKWIRGIAYTTRVSPQLANRMIDEVKELLRQFIPDVYIAIADCKGPKAGKSPGFGLVLHAETTTGVIYTGEAVSRPKVTNDDSKTDFEPSTPKDVADEAGAHLLDEIFRGGCCDSSAQGLALYLMAHGTSDLSKMTLGPLSPFSIHLLRLMKQFLNIEFKLDEEQENTLRLGAPKVKATCIGIGFSNLNKAIS